MPGRNRLTNKELQAIKDLVSGKKAKKPPRTRFIKQELNAIKDMINGKKEIKPRKPKPKPSRGRKLNA